MTEPSFWLELLERFGFPVALISFGCFCIYKVGQFLAPIIRDYVDRKVAAQEKHAEAAVMSAKAASDNAEVLARTAEKAIEIQQEGLALHREQAETNSKLMVAFEAFVSHVDRVDRIIFPSPRRKK
jgi:hypothetical protein